MQAEVYLVDGEEIVITAECKPICDGGGPLGHPREFLTLAEGGETVCKYCDRRYVHVANPAVADIRTKGKRFAASA